MFIRMLKISKSVQSFKRLYHKSNIGSFFQNKPSLKNTFVNDVHLLVTLQRILPKQVYSSISADLESFGEKISTDIDQLGNDCEAHPPVLKQYDAWGSRIDDIQTCDAWKKMKSVSAEEGLISIAYERKHDRWSRIHQMIKLYLFNPSSGMYSCPLAMTDGAARILEKFPDKKTFNDAYVRLTSRSPDQFWTSGQWMTERKGGSDVAGGTDTKARLENDDVYKLYGYKWFSSATDSDMALTLARIADDQGNVKSGSQGLTLFYLETRDSNEQLNNIQVEKLKNKLGTRQLPTAELLLDGTVAHKASEEGRGVAEISAMLTITRIHNAISAVSNMRRILMLASDYSKNRKAFGHLISDYPLHLQTLARMELETRGSLLLILKVADWLGLEDCNIITDHDALMLRLMTPILKLYTAKQAMSTVSEGLEAFGGQGYIEDTGLPKYLRDSQVLPIWEGTTNILSLDVLRSIAKSKGEILKAFDADVRKRLGGSSTNDKLNCCYSIILTSLSETLNFIKENPQKIEFAARDISFSLARIYIGSLLVEHTTYKNSTEHDVETAFRWCCHQDLSPVVSRNKYDEYSEKSAFYEQHIVFDKY